MSRGLVINKKKKKESRVPNERYSSDGKGRDIKRASGLTSTARNRQQSGEHEGIFGVSLAPPYTHIHTLSLSHTHTVP